MKTDDVLFKCGEWDSEGLWAKCGTMFTKNDGTRFLKINVSKITQGWDGNLVISDRPTKDYKFEITVLSHFEEPPF